MTDPITIQSEALSVSIALKGAELQTIRDRNGRDYLWNGDPKWWASRAPLLFPIVGGLNCNEYRLDGKVYSLPRHGFARHQMFRVLRQVENSVTLRLEANDETRAVYPFEFNLDVTYTANGTSLLMEIEAHNLGSTLMPASCGFHPAFAWPLPGETDPDGHVILFDQPEPEPISILDEAGLISGSPRETPVVGKQIALKKTLFEADALIWKSLHSRALTYRGPKGTALHVRFPGMPALGIWTKPGAPYLCIEPWQGFADPAGFDRDFRDKPGVIEIGPDQRRQFSMEVTIA